MKHESAVKKISKFAKVVNTERTHYVADFGKSNVTWFVDGDGEVACMRVVPHGHHDDLQSDYHAGTYVRNCDEAIRFALNDRHQVRFDTKATGQSSSISVRIEYEGRKFTPVAVCEISSWIKRTDAPGFSGKQANMKSSDPELLAVIEGISENAYGFNVLVDLLIEIDNRDGYDNFQAAWDFGKVMQNA